MGEEAKEWRKRDRDQSRRAKTGDWKPGYPRHSSETYGLEAKRMQAKADLMEETRLADKAKQQRELAVAADKIRRKLPKTAESLDNLGAGKNYGE